MKLNICRARFDRSMLFRSVMLNMAMLVMCLVCAFFANGAHAADDSLCAHVKIEIAQELTLERQAFDAHMRINNGITHLALENISITVNFADEDGNPVMASSDPDNQDALFFIRVDSMNNIGDITGGGTVQPSTAADIHWLVIPAPGASKGAPQGTMYYVGATLSYTVGGEEENIDVAPDYIFVKPMPEMAIDYFLPGDVYGDDAFTPEIEPPVPFTLGVRVKNNGAGTARNFRIDSAKPEIVANDTGLLVGFEIQGCEVNSEPATPSLMVEFGDIDPGKAGAARWIMSCSLSGKFTEFNAYFSHSDELGGELTSLIQAVATHRLVWDVLVDLPGRDTVRDFLARDGETIFNVYESDGVDTPVTDQSGNARLEPDGADGRYLLTVPVTAGFMLVSIPDPFDGGKVIGKVTRSDGKLIKHENVWLSKTRVKDGPWQYYFNIFDHNTTSSYSVVFDDAPAVDHAPVLQFIPDGHTVEGTQIAFAVTATDPDGTVPELTALPLPAGARFTDSGEGHGSFDWTPVQGQAGEYSIAFSASDRGQEDARLVTITVCPQWDSDCDKMADQWEMSHFGNLDRDGSNDADRDGISDLSEYLNGTDPLSAENAPSVPVIISPLDGSDVQDIQPALVISNSIDPDDNVISYSFELYSDSSYTTPVQIEPDVSQGDGNTTWPLPQELDDNHWYYWRVRATDGYSFSEWAYGRFFVNTENDPPGIPGISSPADGMHTDTVTPLLEMTNAADPDGNEILCRFEVFSDDSMTDLVASSDMMAQGPGGKTSWEIPVPLDDNATYYWHVVVTDEHGASSHSVPAFFETDTMNSAPAPPAIMSPADRAEITEQAVDLAVSDSSDPDSDSLVYIFQIDTVETFDSDSVVTSPEISQPEGSTSWHIEGLEDNTVYFWRVKAYDGRSESRWTQGSFFLNTMNDTPETPVVINPGNNAWVSTLRPALKIASPPDIDHDSIVYHFEIYSQKTDGVLQELVAETETDSTTWQPEDELQNTTRYYWRVQAEDEHGIISQWSEAASFFIKLKTVNESPEIVLAEPSLQTYVNAAGPASVDIIWSDEDTDSSALIALYYDSDNTGSDGVLIAENIQEDDESDVWHWDVTGVPEGRWYIYGIISDDESSAVSYAPGSVVIDRTAPEVRAEPAGGYLEAPAQVVLSADEQAAIYYTLDGTDPTEDSSLYQEPLSISTETTIKFIAVDAAGNISVEGEEFYFFNRAPDEPSLPEPSDNAPAVSVNTSLSWSGGDPDQGDSVTYDLYLDQNNPPLAKVLDNGSMATFQAEGLDFSASYYWQVVARDSGGLETAGPVWHFVTFTRSGDEDGDGLSNEAETQAGTNPFDWDSDHDGYSDIAEAGTGTDPLSPESRPPFPTSYGDLDGNMVIDGLDLAMLKAAIGTINGDEKYNAAADFNSDGKVDASDLEMFSRIFGYMFETGYSAAADFDRDGDVDNIDMARLASAMNSSSAEAGSGYDETVDMNSDGHIDQWDLALFSIRYGFIAGQ